MVLESTIDEEKITTMTKGERTGRARAQIQEERARRAEEEGKESQDSESKEEGSGSDEGRRLLTSSVCSVAEGSGCSVVLELLRAVDAQLKGMRADIQSLGTRVLAMERRVNQLERLDTSGTEVESGARMAEAGVEAGGEAGAEGTEVPAMGEEARNAEMGVGQARGTDPMVVGADDIETAWGDA